MGLDKKISISKLSGIFLEIACEIYCVSSLPNFHSKVTVLSILSFFSKLESLRQEKDFQCELDLPACRVIWEVFDFLCNESKRFQNFLIFNTSLVEYFFASNL